jgi:hypothetical protein
LTRSRKKSLMIGALKKAARKICFHFAGALSNIWRQGNVVSRTLARRNDMPNLCH